ncbi:MAG TPA: TolC family protein [Vicinamibacterales bacterium]|nr:TolC family protein [Vicinamibacterales bacterium]
MNGIHEPRESFVRALEARVSTEISHRAAASRLPRWVPQSRGRLAFATALLILVSMAAGGAAVSAAYQAQSAEGRDLLVRTYQQRLDLARMRLELASKLSKSLQERAQIGAASMQEMQDAVLRTRQAEWEVQSLQLQLDEVRLTGVEPAMQVSAPLVSGRDFVSQRWQLEMEAQRAALETEQLRLTTEQRRFAAGMSTNADLERVRVQVKELETALSASGRKLDIRRKFLNRTMDAGLADLRVLEVDAEQRVETLTARIDLSRKELEGIKVRVSVGQAHSLDMAEAEVRLQQTEFELSKAQYDLALIKRQIEQRGR